MNLWLHAKHHQNSFFGSPPLAANALAPLEKMLFNNPRTHLQRRPNSCCAWQPKRPSVVSSGFLRASKKSPRRQELASTCSNRFTFVFFLILFLLFFWDIGTLLHLGPFCPCPKIHEKDAYSRISFHMHCGKMSNISFHINEY